MPNPREVAINILIRTETGSYGNLLMNRYLTPDISQKDRSLITELVNGVIKNRLKLDYIISQFSNIKINKIKPYVKNALRLGIYQTFFLDKVPNYAAVNESVSLVKKREGRQAANFTNAVLRNALRKKDEIKYPSKDKDLEKYLSVFYSFPIWLIKRWISLFGCDFTEELCKAFNQRPKLCIRVNTLVTDKESLIKKLEAEGVKVEPGLYADEALYILESPSINQLKSFQEGLFTLQDESSIIASLVVGPKNNDKILDVAAAPGGKSTHMASLMGNVGEVVAWDIFPHRIRLIEENAKRLKTNIVKPQRKDARVVDKTLFEKFDKVLIDAPCSGTGVIGRKPDIKWSKKPEDIFKLNKQQNSIIDTCSNYVKPGGILVYSTCSIDPQENEDVVEGFLKRNNNFAYDDIKKYLPKKLCRKTSDIGGHITMYPNVHKTDGFFVARLKRIK